MRILFEVVGHDQEVAKFPKKNGGTEEVPVFWFSGVDTDFNDELIKVKVYRDFQKLRDIVRKGVKLHVKFKNIRPANKWERCMVITANEGDITIHQAEAERKMAVAGGA